MNPSYKQTCKIDPTKIDFSAFDQKSVPRDLFSEADLHAAGIFQKQGDFLGKAVKLVRDKKHAKVFLWIMIAAILTAIVLFIVPIVTGVRGVLLGLLTAVCSLAVMISVVLFALYMLGWVSEASQRIPLKWLLFASQNGFKYHATSTGDNNMAATAFNLGYTGQVFNTLELDERLSVAEYSYKTKNGEQEITHHFNFARFQLGNNVPHLVLDSKYSALQIQGEQEITLEGNFQDYFTLYAPTDCEVDALQIFTPDVMGTLLDQAGKYDVELIGSDLYIYDMKQGLVESGLTVDGLVNSVEDRKRHSQFINFLTSAIKIASEINEQTDHYINTHL